MNVWNWAEFFQQELQPPFEIGHTFTDTCHALLSLPFSQGLQVIVTSVPKFAHNQWQKFSAQLNDARKTHQHVDYWLIIGELMREYMSEIEIVVRSNNLEHALKQMQALLSDKNHLEQFALMACLYHFAKSDFQARMIFNYLLEHSDPQSQHIQQLLNFYQSLTERQKQVAIYVSRGMTNHEIASTLVIEASVVAEHLTHIFGKFQQIMTHTPDKHGTRYRLIHALTLLFAQHPYLLIER